MKKTFSIAIILLSMQLIAFSQQDTVSRFASTITVADLKKQLTIIASDEMEGRETGTEGQRKAAAYIESQFKSIGLQHAAALNGYQQMFPLYQDSMVRSELMVSGQQAVFGKDYYNQVNISESGKFKSKKIVFVGYGIDDAEYSDYNGIDVKGKIVVFFTGEPKQDGKYLVSKTTSYSEWSFPGTSKKIAAAAARGAVGAFIINPMVITFSPRTIET
ncbi:MAG: hypothetical protein ABIN94_16910, partial [Ferruginibacter sp.]